MQAKPKKQTTPKRRAKPGPLYDWGRASPPAPSIQRVEPWGWVCASALGGAVAGLVALKLQWRSLPGLPMPPGGMAEHLGYWAELACHWASPRLFPTDAAFYAGFFERLPFAQKAGLVGRAFLACCAAAAPAMFLAKPLLRPRDGLVFLRGARRHDGSEAIQRLSALLKGRALRRPDHDIAPGVAYPSDMWTRHVLVVGGVGSGKSTAIKPMIDKIVAAGEQMLLFDPKSEFTVGFGKPALIAPWDARSLAWDVAKDMRNVLDMRRFAATMIRDSTDPMWSNASRQLLVGLLIYLKATRGDGWGWMDLKGLVALPQSELLPIMAEWHPEAVRSVEKASVTTAGILINLSAFCASIFDLAEAWGAVPADRRVSFVDWTLGRSKYPQIILQGHGAYSELTRSYVEGIVGIFSAIVNSVEMKDDPSRKIWFVADEFAQMGKCPVRALFEVGRSRGVRCVVACQDLSQLEEIYGAPMVKALVAMCGTLLVGQIMPGETSDQLCKAFGGREVERENVSSASGGSGRSKTVSYNREEVALYKPSELASRLGLTPDGDGVVLILYTGGEAYELFFPHYVIREEREPHVPAPWTRGIGASRDEAVARHALARAAEAQLASASLAAESGLDSAASGSVEPGLARLPDTDAVGISDFYKLVGVAEGRGEIEAGGDPRRPQADRGHGEISNRAVLSGDRDRDIAPRHELDPLPDVEPFVDISRRDGVRLDERGNRGRAGLGDRRDILMAAPGAELDHVDREDAENLAGLGEGDPLDDAILATAMHGADHGAFSTAMLAIQLADAFADGEAPKPQTENALVGSRKPGDLNASEPGELVRRRTLPQSREDRGHP